MGDYDEGWIDGLPPESEKEVWMLVKDLWGNRDTAHAKWDTERSVWQAKAVGWSSVTGQLEAVAWQPMHRPNLSNG